MTDTDRNKKIAICLKALILLTILVTIPLYFWFFHRDFISEFTSISELEAFLFEHKDTGIILYIAAQVLQILICIIPGQPFQFAAGYVFGPWHALLYSIIGIAIGATLTFFLSKFLGRDAMYMFFGKTRVIEYLEKFSSKKGYILLFILYFIPGFPKDFVNYVAGLSTLKWGPFIIISLAARIPAMMGSILVGTFTQTRNFPMVIGLIIIVAVITLICIRNKEKILKVGDKIYNKLNNLKY